MNCETLQRMKVKEFRQWVRLVVILASCMVVACFFTIASKAQSVTVGRSPQAITLDPPTGWDLQEHAFDAQGNPLPEAPANYRRLGTVTAGQVGSLHTLTLRFTHSVTLRHIKSTKDFRIQRGGSCVEGSEYDANSTCTLLVRFTPQGPGHRLGFLKIANSGETTPSTFGLTGFGYAPVVSFTPAQIATVPATVSSGNGTFSGATSMAIDGGDILYIADTGNNKVKEIDSSGALTTTPLNPIATPVSIAVDSFGILYTSNTGSTYYFSTYYPWGSQTAYGYAYAAGSCTPSTPCPLSTVGMNVPAHMSMDAYDNLFFEEGTKGAAEMPVASISGGSGAFNLWYLSDQFSYSSGSPASFAVDAAGNLYTNYHFSTTTCYLLEESLYNAEYAPTANRVAGGVNCGFSGDGGPARGAEISTAIGQMAFDIAGNLYFADAGNQRVRRIDAVTGKIRTIAGNGAAGYTGDGGKATSAALNNPTGIAVNSQGNVYILSSATSGQVIRQVGPLGYLTFGNQGKGTTGVAQRVSVSNTGNEPLVLTNLVITGTNAADFKIDNTTSTCFLSPGSTLNAGQSCRIGVVFTPAAVGARSATLTLLDNTLNGEDNVTLAGIGVLPSPTFTITAPANGATFTSGTAVTFSVKVSSASGPQPTGKVQFKVDGANYGTAVTVSSTGTASTSVTGLTTTTHTLSATYSGDTNYAAAGPVSVSITIKAAATLKFTSPTSGQTVPAASLPVSVTVTSKTSPVPIGNVTFSVDGAQVGAPVKLVSGSASMTTGSLTAGSHTILAVYSGDKCHRATKASETVNAQ